MIATSPRCKPIWACAAFDCQPRGARPAPGQHELAAAALRPWLGRACPFGASPTGVAFGRGGASAVTARAAVRPGLWRRGRDSNPRLRPARIAADAGTAHRPPRPVATPPGLASKSHARPSQCRKAAAARRPVATPPGLASKGLERLNPRSKAAAADWRRGRDSNPRYPLRYTRFRGARLQPLGHLSVLYLLSRGGEQKTAAPGRRIHPPRRRA